MKSLEIEKFRNCIFEKIVNNAVLERFDTLDVFWERFSARNSKSKKRLLYLDIDHIDDPTLVTPVVNSKEFIEVFATQNTNKKHKGLKNGAKGVEYESYTKRTNLLRDIERFGQLKRERNRSSQVFSEKIFDAFGRI